MTHLGRSDPLRTPLANGIDRERGKEGYLGEGQ